MSTPYSYIIAEDEPLLARLLAQQLNEHWPAARCVGLVSNGGRSVKLATNSPDVAFLDVRMPQLDGLEAARQLCLGASTPHRLRAAYDALRTRPPSRPPPIDYLLKPVETARLTKLSNGLSGQF